jgi:hypothetical protein
MDNRGQRGQELLELAGEGAVVGALEGRQLLAVGADGG